MGSTRENVLPTSSQNVIAGKDESHQLASSSKVAKTDSVQESEGVKRLSSVGDLASLEGLENGRSSSNETWCPHDSLEFESRLRQDFDQLMATSFAEAASEAAMLASPHALHAHTCASDTLAVATEQLQNVPAGACVAKNELMSLETFLEEKVPSPPCKR